jgi:hypothetical protein
MTSRDVTRKVGPLLTPSGNFRQPAVSVGVSAVKQLLAIEIRAIRIAIAGIPRRYNYGSVSA